MRRLAPLADGLVDRLFPSLCLGCTEPLSSGRRALRLCPRCRGRLQPIDPSHACRVCLRESSAPRPGAGGWACDSCRRVPGPLDRLAVAWRYTEPLDRVILAMKLRRYDFLAECLVREALARGLAGRLGRIDLVVPVPMPWPRRLLRGVDAAAELARAVARELDRPLATPLRRAPLAGRQTGTGRDERLRRVQVTLHARPRQIRRMSRRHVLVVDDVVTTGSTLRAMARTLRRLGAARVSALAIAATPDRESPPARRRRPGKG